MRRSPSIVPPGNGSGRLSGARRFLAAGSGKHGATSNPLASKQESRICWTANIAIPFASLHSTLREGWSRDVSEDVAHELRRFCAEMGRDLPAFLQEFPERQEG
jgi:hypothetical protein